MYCPDIRKECRREKCRDWDAEAQKCAKQVQNERTAKLLESYKYVINSMRMSDLTTQLFLNQMLKDPTLPDDVKQAVEKALQAPSADVAEQFLKEAGLI